MNPRVPHYQAFLLSFVVIGLNWAAHLRLFREILHYNQTRFSTSIVSMGLVPVSVVMYSSVMACAGFIHTAIRLYVRRRPHLCKRRSNATIRSGIVDSLIVPAGFSVSIVVSFFSITAAQLLWVVMLVTHILLRNVLRRGTR